VTTLVFDGDCGFCTTCVGAMRRLGLTADEVVAWQQADLPALGLTAEQCAEKLQWVGDSGRRESGHLAVAALLEANGAWRVLGRLLRAPVISPLAARAYTWVADHRMSLPGGTPACGLPDAGRRSPGT
jgi:predicted DCC family thiol-disulfide oxidoreductase YuxK